MNFDTPHKRELGIILGLILLLGLAGLINLLKPRTMMPNSPHQVIAPGVYTVEGQSVCLPHRNTEGPQTLECAFGVRLDDGNHLALDLGNQPSAGQDFNFAMGDRIRVTGQVVPLEAISSNHWQIYANLRGIMRVESVSQVK
jgi:hypothetical protein